MSFNYKFRRKGLVPLGAALGLGAGLLLAAYPVTANEPASLRAALAHCGDIEDNDARLACVDVILEALNQADAVRAEAQAARREAEAARLEAEAAREEAQARIAEAEARRAEAEARMREAEVQLQETERARATLEQTNKAAEDRAAAATRAQADAEKAAARQTVTLTPQPRGGRIPESTPKLFGAVDLSDEAAAALLTGIDLNAAYQAEELERITARVVDSGYNNANKVYVVLEDGQVWRQQGGSRIRLLSSGPKEVEIIRGLLNSFTMQMDGRGRYFKVERVK